MAGSDPLDLWIEVSVVLLMHDPQIDLFSSTRRPGIPTQVLYTWNRSLRLAAPAVDRGGPNRLLKEAPSCTRISPARRLGPRRCGRRRARWRELTVNLPDGRQTGLDERAAHWSFARCSTASHPILARRDGPALVSRDDHVHAQSGAVYLAHVEHALQLFPNDAEMVFLAGCLHEFLAGPRIQAGIRSASLPSGTAFNVASPREELQRAEALFRRALAIEPELTEGRLHLGRVLGLLGRHADAARELDRVVAACRTRCSGLDSA